MADKCPRCHRKLNSDDFLCPQCGAILGDPVSYAKISKGRGQKNQIFNPRILAALSAMFLLLVLLAAAVWSMHPLFDQFLKELFHSNQPESVPTQTTAPLAVYTVEVRSAQNNDLKGTCIHLMYGDRELYTSRIGEEGTASFVLPESEGYSVHLTCLPVQYQVNYGKEVFSFEAGQRSLKILLENESVQYSIKAVDSVGRPIAGVGIMFYASGKDEQSGITDESGVCTFVTDYSTGAQAASITFVPNGYVHNDRSILFSKDSLVSEVVLQTYEEAGYDLKDIYTIRVVDENGNPASDVRLSVKGYFNDESGQGSIWTSGTTNTDGCFSFHYSGKLQCQIRILDRVEYRDVTFEFDEDQHEMQIQLDLHDKR